MPYGKGQSTGPVVLPCPIAATCTGLVGAPAYSFLASPTAGLRYDAPGTTTILQGAGFLASVRLTNAGGASLVGILGAALVVGAFDVALLPTGALDLNGSPGAPGDVPTSAGPGAPVVWAPPASSLPVLYAENPVAPVAPVATGVNAFAIGSGASATGTGNVVLGEGATDNGFTRVVAAGFSASVTANEGVAVGDAATAAGISVAIGNGASSLGGSSSVAIGGDTTTASGAAGIAIGRIAFATATSTVAIGNGPVAAGAESVAIGHSASASAAAAESVALGHSAGSLGPRSVVIGFASVGGTGAAQVAIGDTAITGSGFGQIAIGDAATCGTSGPENIAIGFDAQATGTGGGAVALGGVTRANTTGGPVAIGLGASVTGQAGTAVGASTDAIGQGSVALGTFAQASGLGAIAIGGDDDASGTSANASGSNAIAIGTETTATASRAVAIGPDVNNATADTAMLGTADTNKERIGPTGEHRLVGATAQYVLPNYTVAGLPAGATGGTAFATDDTPPRPRFFDGTAWRPYSFPEFRLQGDQFDNPNSADWAVNALAPAIAGPTNAGLTLRQFSNVTEQGVGFGFTIPVGATRMTFRFKSRGAAAGAPSTVTPRLYRRTVPDNAAVTAWSAALALTAIDIPANTFFQYDSQTITLATLGLAAGNFCQFELTRATGGLAANWLLLELLITFQ